MAAGNWLVLTRCLIVLLVVLGMPILGFVVSKYCAFGWSRGLQMSKKYDERKGLEKWE